MVFMPILEVMEQFTEVATALVRTLRLRASVCRAYRIGQAWRIIGRSYRGRASFERLKRLRKETYLLCSLSALCRNKARALAAAKGALFTASVALCRSLMGGGAKVAVGSHVSTSE